MSRPGADGPENVDATFEEIVADLRAQGFSEPDLQVAEPEADPAPDRDGRDPKRRGAGEEQPDPALSESGWRESTAGWDETMFGPDPASDDEHFVPPEPPPLPKPRKGAFVVLLFFVVGLLLLIAPTVIGLTSSIGTPLGMLALATGIALLLLRVRQGPPDGADPTNGAQV
ncbi:hypothetical protein ACFS2C_08050 [Prauserella oleivorans]|uniref:DUF308 domain-containing protein n=1 Tax=Prauserella oleivorans TaxID=1478153 RepID=A0ABW5W8R5_9PSEU